MSRREENKNEQHVVFLLCNQNSTFGGKTCFVLVNVKYSTCIKHNNWEKILHNWFQIYEIFSLHQGMWILTARATINFWIYYWLTHNLIIKVSLLNEEIEYWLLKFSRIYYFKYKQLKNRTIIAFKTRRDLKK